MFLINFRKLGDKLENLSKKQRCFLYAIALVIVTLIIIYVFTKDNTISSAYDSLYVENTQNIADNSIIEEENLIYIHILGEVEKPSVVKLQDGARIIDAIEKAGGITDSAEVKNLNLAYKLKDGEKIYIPSLDEVLKCEEENKKICYISSAVESGKTEEQNLGNKDNTLIQDTSMKNSNGLIDINTATQTELETLSGIGPSTAKSIIDYRKENGRFKSVDEIMNIKGIGESKFNAIKEQIYVG